MPFSAVNAAVSYFCAASISFCGTMFDGHTCTQRPQRIHAVSSKRSTSSCIRHVSADYVLSICTSSDWIDIAIIGPPSITFFTPSFSPPEASASSAKQVPILTL